MKRKLIGFAATILLFASHLQAQTVIHYWNFNSVTTSQSGPVVIGSIPALQADYSDTFRTSIKGFLAYRALAGTIGNKATYYDTTGGSNINLQLAAPVGNSIRFHNPCDTMEARFYVPSGGYKDVIFGFGGQQDGGANILSFSYSIDSGQNWLTNGIKKVNNVSGSFYDTLTTNWALCSVFFDSTVNNNNRFVIRMQFLDGSSGSIGGDKFDNVTLKGTPYNVSVPHILSCIQVTPYPDPASTNINIEIPTEAEKNVIVFNMAGQSVYHAVTYGTFITIPVTDMRAGIYNVLITDNRSGAQYLGKFVRE